MYIVTFSKGLVIIPSCKVFVVFGLIRLQDNFRNQRSANSIAGELAKMEGTFFIPAFAKMPFQRNRLELKVPALFTWDISGTAGFI